MSIFNGPGIDTDVPFIGDDKMRAAQDAGFNRLTWQIQNGNNPVKYADASIAGKYGMEPGGWGVSYSQDALGANMETLVRQAKDLGMTHIKMNVELDTLDPTPLINAGQEFPGPKCFTCLIGDAFGIHAQTMVNAGWWIEFEVYPNVQANLSISVAKDYHTRAGIPEDKFVYLLGTFPPEIPIGDYIVQMQQSAIGKNYCVWMGEYCSVDDFKALGAYNAAVSLGGDYYVKLGKANIHKGVEIYQSQGRTLNRTRAYWMDQIGQSSDADFFNKWLPKLQG